VTCTDSGGPAELVEDGVNGFICAPEPAALARALRQLIDDRSLAERLGAAAHATGEKLNWPDTIRALTAYTT
jgi:glycosyltransferase involved in cell wall biosynthesis